MAERKFTYNILTSDSPLGLAVLVNDLVESGWDLYGNPFTSIEYPRGNGTPHTQYHQAMVKFNEHVSYATVRADSHAFAG